MTKWRSSDLFEVWTNTLVFNPTLLSAWQFQFTWICGCVWTGEDLVSEPSQQGKEDVEIRRRISGTFDDHRGWLQCQWHWWRRFQWRRTRTRRRTTGNTWLKDDRHTARWPLYQSADRTTQLPAFEPSAVTNSSIIIVVIALLYVGGSSRMDRFPAAASTGRSNSTGVSGLLLPAERCGSDGGVPCCVSDGRGWGTNLSVTRRTIPPLVLHRPSSTLIAGMSELEHQLVIISTLTKSHNILYSNKSGRVKHAGVI